MDGDERDQRGNESLKLNEYSLILIPFVIGCQWCKYWHGGVRPPQNTSTVECKTSPFISYSCSIFGAFGYVSIRRYNDFATINFTICITAMF